MNVFYLVLGAALLLIAVVDLLWTTLWVDGGAGPLSARLTTGIWRALRLVGGRRSRLLSLAGPVILLAILLTWVALTWAGWTFLFAGGDDALVATRPGETVTWAGRIYFVAYTMFTMGNGDFSPQGPVWQIATALTTASGMVIVTLSVSYVLAVLGAVVAKRSLAGAILSLGGRGEDVLRVAWDGKDLHALDAPLNAVAAQVGLVSQQHKAYPILHYYHSGRVDGASAVGIAVLEETITLLDHAVPPPHGANPVIVAGARSSVERYLATLNGAFIDPARDPPPPPDLGRLREAGIPTVSDEAFARALDDLAERRRKTLGMLRADAWPWPPVER